MATHKYTSKMPSVSSAEPPGSSDITDILSSSSTFLKKRRIAWFEVLSNVNKARRISEAKA